MIINIECGMEGYTMDSLIFALNAVLPIVLTVAIGYILKRIGLMNGTLAGAVNKLVFHLFLPCMLFLNVYGIESLGSLETDYLLYAFIVLLVVFLISLPLVLAVTKKRERRGALWQASFRSNYALVGIPLASSLFGAEGSMVATLLSAVVVPVLNIMGVISLSLFRKTEGRRPTIGSILLDIVKNPLIQSIAAGLVVLGLRAVFVQYGVAFRLTDLVPVYTVLGYLSRLATPLALLCLGAQFEFSAVSSLKKEILFGVLMRTVLVPLLGIGTAYLLFRSHFSGAHFAAFVAVFATPVSVSSVPMTQEMGGDVTLAGQLVIWTTIVSGLSVFVISFLLRAAGIF